MRTGFEKAKRTVWQCGWHLLITTAPSGESLCDGLVAAIL